MAGNVLPLDLLGRPAVETLAVDGELGLKGEVRLVAGANVSLSQAGQTISIAAAAGGAGGGVNIAASNTTFTSGTVNFSGDGAQITVGSVAQGVRISGLHPGVRSIAVSNTTYTSGQVQFTGVGGGVTVSSNTGQRVDISVAAPVVQSAQTGISSIAASNTTYTSGQVQFTGVGGGITVSSNTGQRVDLSVAAPVAQSAQTQSNIQAISNSNTTYVTGTVGLSELANITIRSTTGQQFQFSVAAQSAQTQSLIQGIAASNTTYNTGTVQFTGVGGITVSSNTGQRVDLSVALAPAAMSHYQNLLPGAQALTATIATSNGTLLLFPLFAPGPFPGDMTVSTALLNMSGSLNVNSASTGSYTQRVSLGVYTASASTLNLVNSVSASWGTGAANSSISSQINGYRYVTFNSTDWSSSPVFKQGSIYYVGLWMRSSGEAKLLSLVGANLSISDQRSGTMGTSIVTATSMGGLPYGGAYSVSFSTAMPTSIHVSAISRAVGGVNFNPHIVFENRMSAF